MCVGGKFVNMGCAATTQCFALPLVNKPGTSLACTTESDALARIAAPGATGGLTGSDQVTATARGVEVNILGCELGKPQSISYIFAVSLAHDLFPITYYTLSYL